MEAGACDAAQAGQSQPYGVAGVLRRMVAERGASSEGSESAPAHALRHVAAVFPGAEKKLERMILLTFAQEAWAGAVVCARALLLCLVDSGM